MHTYLYTYMITSTNTHHSVCTNMVATCTYIGMICIHLGWFSCILYSCISTKSMCIHPCMLNIYMHGYDNWIATHYYLKYCYAVTIVLIPTYVHSYLVIIMHIKFLNILHAHTAIHIVSYMDSEWVNNLQYLLYIHWCAHNNVNINLENRFTNTLLWNIHNTQK